MAAEHRIFKQDGYLNLSKICGDSDGAGGTLAAESRTIIYHPNLNVIVLIDTENRIRILDVNSGQILQTYDLLGNENDRKLMGKFMPLQEKILVWDGHSLGFRGDYNGVLLLDTIFQPPIAQNDDLIKLELVLSEAVIFQTTIKELEQEGLEAPTDVVNELYEKIKWAQENAKKGIKAQRWNTICLEVTYSSIKLLASNVVSMLNRLDRHIPALAIASAINERLTDLMARARSSDMNWHGGNIQRVQMNSEAVRRQTFAKWPHMDYKWALPDQMAQAGFYHQPSSSGEDRAMCFTCSVCLVCWEKTDEPWSEHERHSPTCPFVKGEYTQNVPISVTYATSAAIIAPGLDFDIVSNSDYANVLCTGCSQTGDITIWSIERQMRLMHTFNIATLMKDIFYDSYDSVRITAICVLPNNVAQSKLSAMKMAQSGSMNGNNTITPIAASSSTLRGGVVGSKIILGLTINRSAEEHLVTMAVLNIVESERVSECESDAKINKQESNTQPLLANNADGGDSSLDSNTLSEVTEEETLSTGIKKFTDALDPNTFLNDLMLKNVDPGSGDKSVESSSMNDLLLNEFMNLMDIVDIADLIPQSKDLRDNIESSLQMFMAEHAKPVQMSNGIGTLTPNNINNNGIFVANKTLLSNNNSINNNHNNNSHTINSNNNNHNNNSSSSLSSSNDNNGNSTSNNNSSNMGSNAVMNNGNLNNNNTNSSLGIGMGLANNEGSGMYADDTKSLLGYSEEIECVVESFANVMRLNRSTCESGGGRKVFEIGEIMPTNSECQQILVKLITKLEKSSEEIIMTAVPDDVNDESNDLEQQSGVLAGVTGAQLLVFDLLGSAIAFEYTLVAAFTREKFPTQLCILPEFRVNVEGLPLQVGALCAVCADGSVAVYSLTDFHLLTVLREDNDKFISITYCNPLERLCGCTRKGGLVFYTANDNENESGDEMLEMEDEILPVVTNNPDVTVAVDGISVTATDGDESASTSSFSTTPNIKVECGSQGSAASSSSGPAQQTSPSISAGSSGNNSNILAYRTGEFTSEELLTLYRLTLFDENLTVYSAEVPSCWNDLGQAQKQRKQSQHMRPDDTQFTKTWRLHNDATSWDEHIIELNLAQYCNVGHIDLKFSIFQVDNPATIQVTLLKQNTSGFGYRMKGSHQPYKHVATDDNMDSSTTTDAHQNPVLSEEYLQNHNAEVLAGPIKLSSCYDLYDQGGVVTLTSPKLLKTRTRNFLLHFKTMSDPSKESQGKTRVPLRRSESLHSVFKDPHYKTHNQLKIKSSISIHPPISNTPKIRTRPVGKAVKGCDWLHEISINVRCVKPQPTMTNERLQRIGMLESNILVENLMRIISGPTYSQLDRNVALDIMIWIATIRLCRYRSPKSERIKGQINKQNAANHTDLVAQQFECICNTEKYLESIIRNSIVYGNRVMAHKTVKLVFLLSEGNSNLPAEIQKHSTFEQSILEAFTNTLSELPNATHASAVRWFTMLACTTITNESNHGFSVMCVQLLHKIAEEINKRSDPYCALMVTRFGLYGFPFDPEIFDHDLPNINRTPSHVPPAVINLLRKGTGFTQCSNLDIKKLSSIDGVDFRTFPHLIRCKSVSNQLRGLLEVEQLHFTCTATSEATRIDMMDQGITASTSLVNMEDLLMGPLPANPIDVSKMDAEKLHDLVNNSVDKHAQLKMQLNQIDEDSTMKPNGIEPTVMATNILIDGMKGNKVANDKTDKTKLPNTKVTSAQPKFKAACQYIEFCDESSMAKPKVMAKDGMKKSPLNQMPMPEKLSNDQYRLSHGNHETNISPLSDDSNASTINVLPWHKLLTLPPKQMIVIDRMHSGARRFVVLDFGTTIMLTDLVIPACDDLSSLTIDIWCFDEELDSVRLAMASDIGTKTLVLADLQPPPICRFMKITIVGRVGMSSTKCKIPIGTFYGHTVVLESEAYGDPLIRYMHQMPESIAAQLEALEALYEDVSCRYNLASSKLMEILTPILHSELSNVAHMQAFISKQREEDSNHYDTKKIVANYEECILLQYQMNVIRNVANRMELTLTGPKLIESRSVESALHLASRDKLRTLSLSLVEILLHFSFNFAGKNTNFSQNILMPVHELFTIDVANTLFNSLVIHGDAHLQFVTCSLLVRICCFQNWWGDFIADIFCNLFSSQNSKIFPQDRVFFLLTYLGRRSIAMGTCRSIVIDAMLKTLAKLLAPISPRYQEAASATVPGSSSTQLPNGDSVSIWSKTDLQLITWVLLFISVCLDDNIDRRDKTMSRWDFMSCESDFTKTRSPATSSVSKQLRCFKKRIIQQTKYNVQPYTDWGKKILMIQNEHPGIFMELSGKSKQSSGSSKSGSTKAPTVTTKAPPSTAKESHSHGHSHDTENFFDKGLKSIPLKNILIVIHGLIALLLEMDFSCNMDQFLLTCKVIARLVAALGPIVQLSKIITVQQLEQLIRLAVWNDQQQPWAVHAITCLLQDLLDADKCFKDHVDNVEQLMNQMQHGQSKSRKGTSSSSSSSSSSKDTKDMFSEYSSAVYMSNPSAALQAQRDLLYDPTKYTYLPSLIECDDTEFDEILNDIDIIERAKPMMKRESGAICSLGINTLEYFCKSISSAMDARLETGINMNLENQIRMLSIMFSLHMYSALPQICENEMITSQTNPTPWPEFITEIWSGPEYNTPMNTYKMFKDVFDCIFQDLHLQDTWIHLEQVLQMWLTLNGELSDRTYNSGISQNDIPKIPFGANAVQGLLMALAWHSDIKLRTWSVGFQCLFLACNSQPLSEDDIDCTRINEVIVNDEHFEKMLLRFLSGYGLSSSIITNRSVSCAGPTICKHMHELIMWLYRKGESNDCLLVSKRKLKDSLLQVVLQLVQPGGAISNKQGPIDAQSQLLRDMLLMFKDKADTNISLKIIESISFLVYNTVSNCDPLQCQRTVDNNSSSSNFGSLFANVLGAENSKQHAVITESSLIMTLIRLASSLMHTELPRQPTESPIPEEEELSNESKTDETKAEQLNIEVHRAKLPCIADTVLRNFSTMKRLLGSLSQCVVKSSALSTVSSNVMTMKYPDTLGLDDPQTAADAVYLMMATLCDRASNARLVLAPVCQYLESNLMQRSSLPRLKLSEPFMWFLSRVLEMNSAVQVFAQLGGIRIICDNMVKLNKVLINMQPGLISSIMQHMTKNTKLKLYSHACPNPNNKKSSTPTQTSRNLQEGLINFAPFCTISSENDNAQSTEVLIMNSAASHRRPRTPPWSYMFYPNEPHVDLQITLPTAILLKEVQLQPHAATLVSCPSAVALEVSRDYDVSPVPVGAPLETTGMTCIRLKLTKPEIATSLVLRLYRPKDTYNMGLTQIVILGKTIFAPTTGPTGNRGTYMWDLNHDDDIFAKTNFAWVRLLARCFNVASVLPDSKLAAEVIGGSASYPGFLEACCSLMHIMPLMPSTEIQSLQSVLLKIGSYSKEMCLTLMRILLWNSVPQTFKLTNESICDLLFDLATALDSFIVDKVKLLLEWVLMLRQNYSVLSGRCNNPQSGFVRVIASIFWVLFTENYVENFADLISIEVFDACIHWVHNLDNEAPLKQAFDSLLCSLCCIKPSLFKLLLLQVHVNVPQPGELYEDLSEFIGTGDDTEKTHGLTDDKKNVGGNKWFAAAFENLKTLLERPAYLSTIALACQSPIAVYLLVDSGLPKVLAHALNEYCCALSPEVRRASLAYMKREKSSASESPEPNATNAATCTEEGATQSQLTDNDKADSGEEHPTGYMPHGEPLLTCLQVQKILDFFSECCAEAHMRDWLGTQRGSIFWKPLLELLCNHRPTEFNGDESMQQSFIRIERATINFFSRVTTCHPRNQDMLSKLLISVIRPPPAPLGGGKPTISGFTRQLVLQLLLENERILVSVRSKTRVYWTQAPSHITSFATTHIVNNHPSKRVNEHHLLFSVNTNTKCQDIHQQCLSVYNSFHSPTQLEPRVCNAGRDDDPGPSMPSMGDDATTAKSSSESSDKSCSLLNFNLVDSGMEFLSVAAGVTAKDKRLKEARNHAAAHNSKDHKDLYPQFSKLTSFDDLMMSTDNGTLADYSHFVNPDCPSMLITGDTTISQILAAMHSRHMLLSTPCITLELVPGKRSERVGELLLETMNLEPLPSPLQLFSRRGGLSLLAQYLPTVYPDTPARRTSTMPSEKEKNPPLTDWVKLEPNDEIYEDVEDPISVEPTVNHTNVTSVPQHSLAAFGLFLRLPSYSDVLLRDKMRAQCLLRLVLGVTGDGEGNDIYSLALAPSLPTLPFDVFRQLLDSSPLTTDDGLLLRRMVIEVGAMHLVLNCLSIFTHQSQNSQLGSSQTDTLVGGNAKASAASASVSANGADDVTLATSDDKSHIYWAKGTGFGTGSTAQSWNVEQALMRQKSEEEHVTVLLQVLSSYINPRDTVPLALLSEEILNFHEVIESSVELPNQFLSLLQKSCLIPALSSYLRNDSVLDITRHIPLYRAILQLLRALTLSPQLVSFLQPSKQGGSSSPSIGELLANMRTCVDTYAKRLRVNKKSNIKGQIQQVTVNLDDGDDEGLALLIPDIQETTSLVKKTMQADLLARNLLGGGMDEFGGTDGNGGAESMSMNKTIEQRYLDVMKTKQFDSYDMIVETETNSYRFVVSYHFEKMVRMAGDRYHPARVKRLAQEAVTLSTSLPLSFSSSVFVRCDTDRLDIMKVLITGPADTPYANGCFEFDVFFPPDYPNLPMLINLETTGRHSVRFNPNLYNDGKVCLSVLNTWHGRPEEKWNASTSSFLQVLVSIQSLILVPEPYFNEPGFERTRGTPNGTHASREYNSNIYQACVRWAMLEQIRNPSPCFKDVIHTHFWLKRKEICAQIEGWLEELSKPQYSERNSRTISFNLMVLRRQYRHLREELAKLKVPEGLEDLDEPFSPAISAAVMAETTTKGTGATSAITTTTNISNISEVKQCDPSSSSNVTTGSSTNLSTVAKQDVTTSAPPLGVAESSESEAASIITPPSSSSCSDITPIPLLVEVTNEFNDLVDVTALLPPQIDVPEPVTAKISTVELHEKAVAASISPAADSVAGELDIADDIESVDDEEPNPDEEGDNDNGGSNIDVDGDVDVDADGEGDGNGDGEGEADGDGEVTGEGDFSVDFNVSEDDLAFMEWFLFGED